MTKLETKQILVDVEDLINIAKNYLKIANVGSEGNSIKLEIVAAEAIAENLETLEDIACKNGIEIDHRGFLAALENYNEN